MQTYKQKKSEYIITGYIRNNIIAYIPAEIIQVIFIFYDNSIFFDVYNKSGKNIISNCKHIFVNSEACFLINGDGILYGYGENSRGQLGFHSDYHAFKDATEHPYFKDKNIELISDSISNDHAFIYLSNGTLYGFGYNQDYHLGFDSYGDNVCDPTPVIYDFKSKLMMIKCSYTHSLFLTDKGNVYGCGSNYCSQLSNKYDTNNVGIQCIINTNNVKHIECCDGTSFVIYNDDTGGSFGDNTYGQLGATDCILQESSEIEIVFNGTKIKSLGCGGYHFGLITMDNKLFMFGRNDECQCGLKDKRREFSSGNEIILDDEIIIQIKCGYKWVVIKTNNDNYYIFGNSDIGKLIPSNSEKFIYKPTLILPEYIHAITKSRNKIIDIIPAYDETFILQQSCQIKVDPTEQ